MSDPINRAQLLRGDLHGKHASIRPPWAKAEAVFLEQCTRCDDCVRGCQKRIIQRGNGGYPQVDFTRGYCTFCGDCVKACGSGALAFFSDLEQPPWSLSVEFGDDCLAMNGVVCRSCSERCEESAIRFQLRTGGRAIPIMEPDRCSGCGDCFAVCPTRSIHIRPGRRELAA
ncbi:MAG: ferredoxin-type protein NapF [Pseudomonadota bacterium]